MSSGSPILLKKVSENQFSGKTHCYTFAPWRPYANLSAASSAVTTDITFHVVLRRKTLFYLTNIILPIMIISFLSVFMFHLPAESKVQTFTLNATAVFRVAYRFYFLGTKFLSDRNFITKKVLFLGT